MWGQTTAERNQSAVHATADALPSSSFSFLHHSGLFPFAAFLLTEASPASTHVSKRSLAGKGSMQFQMPSPQAAKPASLVLQTVCFAPMQERACPDGWPDPD